jgi:serine/threonine protein kinase
MNELDAEAKPIFLDAIEQASPEEAAAFLDSACRDKPTLRARVEELLRAHHEAGRFLGSDSPSSGGLTAERPGTVIGNYKLLEQIGEGGFGVVFLAEQRQPIRRTVALKVLKPGMDSRLVIARFEAERQALALMDHPNIARVLDAGQTPTGRPYFVMELVQGVPITRYCDQQQLPVRQRLELFVSVCRAVQHAHHKGIIHRDLKPTNVLVAASDGRPVPKVIDFGVAKALGQQLTESTLVTGFGRIVGTLEYMSPEQAEFNAVDVDTRADVYSLGVLMYELLTGTTPLGRERLAQAPMTEVLRLIREEEPPKPSTRLREVKDSSALNPARRGLGPARFARDVRGELDWIVMRCLEKDRTRRYGTADGLARDIERYLHDEPVEASPPSRIYRLRKFTRKNRRLIGTAATVAFLLAAGAGVSTWQALRARAAERQALAALEREADELEQVKRSEAQAEAVLHFFQNKVLSAARPKGEEGGLGSDATIRAALDRAEPSIATSFANEPLVEASIRNTLGVSYWYLGDNEAALRQQERALALRRQVLGRDHLETVGAMNDVAIIYEHQARYKEAEKLHAEVVDVKRRTLGPEDPSTLKSMNNLATSLAEQGLLEEASKVSRETLGIQRRLLGPEDLFTLRSAYNLAIMLRHVGRVDESHRMFDDTLHSLRRAFGPEHQDTLRVMNELGELLLEEGDGAEARRILAITLEAKQRVLGPGHLETLITMANLADASRAVGRLPEAAELAARAAEQHRHAFGPEHPQTVVALTILANLYRDQGKLREAVKLYEDTLAVARRVLGPRMPETQHLLNAYAWTLATAPDATIRQPSRAVELAHEALRYAPAHAEMWTTLGVACCRAGDWKDGIAALQQSETLAPGRFTGVNGFFLAIAHWQVEARDEARQWYDKGVAAAERKKPNDRVLTNFRVEAERLLGDSDGSPRPDLDSNSKPN